MQEFVRLCVLPLATLTIMPNMSIELKVENKLAVSGLKYAIENKQRVVFVAKKHIKADYSSENLQSIGVACDVKKINYYNDYMNRVTVDGLTFMDVSNIEKHETYLMADCSFRKTDIDLTLEEQIAIREYLFELLNKHPYICNENKNVEAAIFATESLEIVINLIAGVLNRKADLQVVAKEKSLKERVAKLSSLINNEIESYGIRSYIQKIVEAKITDKNKEFFLREQLQVINAELGIGYEDQAYLNNLEKLIAPDSVKEKLLKDIEKLAKLPDGSSEKSMLAGYLDWVFELPWGRVTKDLQDLQLVKATLDADHFGIEKVKKRIVEHLAVNIFTKGKSRGSAICLVGPPGVGKTSIVKSIANALGKEFVQLTLGGVHDEAEIRGHRKTYIGAMPGRIMSSLAKSKTNNPLFLLDEVDKITRDMRGDPAAALLEVLDNKQNKLFRDNYLEIPYDLSEVMFVLTANDVSELDRPLLDRLEVIQMDGYTIEEKITIASKYLFKKQMLEHGLDCEKVVISTDVYREIIEKYTNESGVRGLERMITTICRKIVYDIVNESKNNKFGICKKFEIRKEDLIEYLGTKRNEEIGLVEKGKVGQVTGLAWTSLGGTTLDVEVSVTVGKGELKLTGQLGEVMRESAVIALSVVKCRAVEFNIDPAIFANIDVHLHVPKGSIHKDGPSAGITIATAILSAITKRIVKDAIAMTGELSLGGKVLPIGGLKEKALAGSRIGVKKILIPKANFIDLEDIPEEVKNKVEFLLVDNIDEVFKEAVTNAN